MGEWSRDSGMEQYEAENSTVIKPFGFAALSTLGVLTGEYIRARILRYNTEELAITKHYLMLHPEKFPEPEHMKYGDKRVFYPWLVWRRPCSGLQPEEDKSKQPLTTKAGIANYTL